VDVDTLLLLLFGLFVQFGPFLIIVAVLVGGVLLGVVVVAIVGAVRPGCRSPRRPATWMSPSSSRSRRPRPPRVETIRYRLVR